MAEPSHDPQTPPSLRTVAMPADTNPNGDIFGGWLMAQMDLAGGVHAYDVAQGRVVTIAVEGMTSTGAIVHDGGTVVVVQGPRFSTRAESASYAAAGWQIINMTQMPEAALAAEAGICFVNVSVITDYDVGVDGGAPVTHEEVLRRFGESLETLKAGIASMVPDLAAASLDCPEP